MAVLIERESRARVEEASIVETEAQLRESKKEMERYLKDYEKLFQETQRLTEQLESLMYSNETTENENEVRRRDVSVRERNVNTLKSESSQLNKAKDVVLKKLAAAEKQRETWEQEREELRSRIGQLSTLEIRSAWREGEGFVWDDSQCHEVLYGRPHRGDDGTVAGGMTSRGVGGVGTSNESAPAAATGPRIILLLLLLHPIMTQTPVCPMLDGPSKVEPSV